MEEDKTSTVVSESIVVNEENSNNNDDDDNNALVERVAGEEAEVEEAETELGGGDDGAVVVGDTETEELTGLELVAVKKNNTRGPPRKYDVDGGGDDMVVGPVLLPPGSSSESATKRRRGRPRGSGKLQLIASLGGSAADTAGASFTPHVVNVQTNEDIVSKIASFSQRGPRSVCILSATGIVSRVTISQPGNSGGILRYEGRFEILSLSGSYTFVEKGGANRKLGMLSVSLAKPDGRVFGGGIAGALIAAGPIQLIVGSFKQKLNKKLKRRRSIESSSSAIIPSPTDLVRFPIHMAKLTDGDDSCTTPTSSLMDPVQGGAVGVLVVRPNMNPASLHSVSPDTFQPMSDQITSPDVDASIP
ncbi:AT-hook motif nuclear-localized protein 7-like [Quercus robur]|uniref:AT-hook motif nuclear-localized protein 7-like n=1 Tax=Quercus robur TaxID=38942 RepID=UPI002163A5DC|nr:AT-hook motif nuclear-localized protein 7-like [Quercus robur]